MRALSEDEVGLLAEGMALLSRQENAAWAGEPDPQLARSKERRLERILNLKHELDVRGVAMLP